MNRSLFFVIACLSFTNAFSQNSVVLDEVTSGLSKPIGIVNDGKSNFLYVVEQGGTIKKFDPIQKSSPELFANLTSKVNSNGGEKGLLGLAFHPKYDENGFFFVNYTTASQSIIARFKALNGVFDLASEKIILSVAQPFSNHNAGDLAFGPDGFLYVPMGDGGSGGDPGNRAQNGQELLGKILRIDINTENAPYLIPADNPFVSSSTVKPEIWALGLRNPWRISFTKGGDLYIADVGQDKMEEINFHAANDNSGLNYGWRCKEGTDNYNTNGCGDLSRFTNPIHTYLHSSSNGCSVTGGHVYEGSMESLKGKYFFGDFCSGKMWWLTNVSGVVNTEEVFNMGGGQLSAFGLSTTGEIYVTGYNQGEIYKINDPTTGFDDLNQTSSDIVAYPNPTNGKINIESDFLKKYPQLILHDATGREVLNTKVSNDSKVELDMALFPKGVYLLSLRNENTWISSKIINE